MRLSVFTIPLLMVSVTEAHLDDCHWAGHLCNADWWMTVFGDDEPKCCGAVDSDTALFCSNLTLTIHIVHCPPGYTCVELINRGTVCMYIDATCVTYELRVRTVLLVLVTARCLCRPLEVQHVKA